MTHVQVDYLYRAFYSPVEALRLIVIHPLGRGITLRVVETRFGTVEACSGELQFLSDNGGANCAHETHAVARELGITPLHPPMCSPQSNGMAESFVNTFKRDYMSQMDRIPAKDLPGAADAALFSCRQAVKGTFLIAECQPPAVPVSRSRLRLRLVPDMGYSAGKKRTRRSVLQSATK